MHKSITKLIIVLFSMVLVACITAVDNALPYAQLPEIIVATPFNLVASPSHPTAYLTDDLIAAGEKVQVIGSDKNAAWLLVLHNNLLGWMPTFYSRTNVATLKAPIVMEPLSDKCAKYLGATFAPDEAWTSNTSGAVYAIGAIYRPQMGKQFDEAGLTLQIDGNGTVIDSDYLHTALTPTSAVILFAYSVAQLQKGDHLSFALNNPSNEPIVFQAAFFHNDCLPDLAQLPIGKTKTPMLQQPSSNKEQMEQKDATAQPETPEKPIIIKPSEQRPDNQFLYTNCMNNNCDIYLWDLERKQARRITDDPQSDFDSAWSPDGQKIVFISERSGNSQLYLFDVASNRIVKQLTQSVNSKGSPAWSPDGKYIAYVERFGNDSQIMQLNVETLETKRLTQTGRNVTPQWSPMGDKIAFCAVDAESNNDNYHIYVMDANGNNVRPVTDDPNYSDVLPYWMPDGIHLIFGRQTKGIGEIYRVNVDTGDSEALTFTSDNEVHAVPSPDGSQFLIVKNENRLRIYLASWDGEQLGEPQFLVDGAVPTWRPHQ